MTALKALYRELCQAPVSRLDQLFANGKKPETAELCGWEPGTRTVAVIYLGWPIGETPAPARPDPDITRVVE